jgi:hypothetical protein
MNQAKVCSFMTSVITHSPLPVLDLYKLKIKKKIPWSESASKLYRPSGHRLSAKLVPTFADKGFRMVSVMDPYNRILGS